MSATLPAELPKCKQHGQMELRPLSRQNKEQRWCGVWYDCVRCGASVLYESDELKAQLADQRKHAAPANEQRRLF